MYNRVNCKTTAKEYLRGNWSYMAGITVLIFIFSVLVSFICFLIVFFGWIVLIGIAPCITFAQFYISRKLYHKESIQISDIFSGIPFFLKCFGLFLWMELWTTLWTFLFVIPGIIKSYSYSMAFYCLVENPELSIRQALNESKRLTKGRKFDLFVLQLSFIGWAFLAMFTFGFGMLFLIPYMNLTTYCAFTAIREEKDGILEDTTIDA